VGRARVPVGAAQRGPLRRGRGKNLALGAVERAQHRLLERHARGVPEAV
nr:hypothetical protein [Tanacetum cinerariifolium]